MDIKKNTLLIIVIAVLVLAVIVILVLYNGNGTMMDGGKNLMTNESGWTGRNIFEWFPEVFTLGFVALIGRLIFKKKV